MPNTKTPSISSEVPIGRRMKGSEMLIDFLASRFAVSRCCLLLGSSGGSRCGSLDFHPCAIGQPVLAIDNDPLARRQALSDDRKPILHRGDFDRAPLDRVVVLDDIGIGAVRAVLYGLRRNGRRAFLHRQDQPYIDELAGP